MVNVDQLSSRDAVHGYVEQICFKTGPPRVVGAELEWLVAAPTAPYDPIPIPRLREVLAAAGPLPGGSTITFEPGGQVELSSPPLPLSSCWQALETDVHHLEQALEADGVTLLPSAIDPYRKPNRQVVDPRYDAMEAYFDRRGPHGRVMMCSTAAIQVNLDAGSDAADVARRWRILNAVGPALVAAFANAPVHAGRVTGWKSTRQAVWQSLDSRRTSTPLGPDPAGAWVQYALDAPVMLMRTCDTQWASDPGFTFDAWMNGAGPAGPPTRHDLAYHLTTLFPPVRPRGWLEVRYIDALPPPYWAVPVAVLTALTDVPGAGEIAAEAAASVENSWVAAARDALADPGLARAAQRCFEVALDALPELKPEPALVALVESYNARYVARRSCPADDTLASASHAEQEELV